MQEQKRRYYEVLLRAIEKSAALFDQYGTAVERVQRDELTRRSQESDDERWRELLEELLLLERAVEVRQLAGEAEARGDLMAIRALATAHLRWQKQMRAIRIALNRVGWRRASFSLDGDQVHISIKTPDSSEIRIHRAAFEQTLAEEFGGEHELQTSFSTWYPLASPVEGPSTPTEG